MNAVNQQWAQLTPEDAAILERSLELPSVLLGSDNIDYRAMLAREVFAEREWRIHGIRRTPLTTLSYERTLATDLREYIEDINGEALA